MSLIRRISGSLVVAAVIACSSDRLLIPPLGFPAAHAEFACGPADGPAVAVFLTSDATESPSVQLPYVRVYVARSIDELDGRAWAIAGTNSQGGAWFQSTTNTYEIATRGFIIATTKTVGSGKVVDGTVDLTFPTAGRVHGGFHAPYSPGGVLCG